ncbi:hypothetical protein [Roseibium sp.]|uniref:hypothetical protein n=1 Tax=Roseibium sp. TaxID=1936156 RepID=UPI003BA97C7E
MKTLNAKLEVALTVLFGVLYFLLSETELNPRSLGKLGGCFIFLCLYLFFSYFRRKREAGDLSYVLEVASCAFGWFVYYLLLHLFPGQYFVSFAYGFMIFFSVYLGLVYLAKFMLKITGEEDRY